MLTDLFLGCPFSLSQAAETKPAFKIKVKSGSRRVNYFVASLQL